jgi:acetyl esterase/lipase
MKSAIVITFFLILNISAVAQQTIPLYDGPIPNSKPSPDVEKTEQRDGITIISKISIPTLAIYLPSPEMANGTAVIICPGGGYWVNAYSHEGTDVARRFNEMGIAAFVLKYRLPDDATMIQSEIGPLQDAQQAIMTVRNRSVEWGIRPDQIGIMGFSAGGHLASTAGTHFKEAMIENPNNISLRPDFLLLIYPVISFQESIGHTGSRDQLIGKNPTKDKIDFYSSELQVAKDTPPSFLVHASDDSGVNPENSVVFYQQLLKHKVPAELHLYQGGGHGFGMNNKTTSDQWMDRCAAWITANGWGSKPGK